MTHTASLVWITPDAESLVGKIARVSNPKNENNPEVSKLLSYLIKNKHWSPFEMASMCVEIHTTRSIAAQILRHRSFSFQEFSQRYAEVISDPVIPELRRQDAKNRQNSIDDLDPLDVQHFQLQLKQHYQQSQYLYTQMLKAGVAKECAREVLPLSTPSRLYMSGTLRSWIHYTDLRSANGTQAEHQQIALAVQEILRQEVPTIYQAVHGSCN